MSITTKKEYLDQLHKYLKKLPREDYEDAMEYFTEYFEETDDEGAQKLMEELGTPKQAARDLIGNLLDKKTNAYHTSPIFSMICIVSHMREERVPLPSSEPFPLLILPSPVAFP